MEREKIINDLLDNMAAPEGLSKDQAWEKLNKRIQSAPTTKVVPMWKRALPYVSVAAVLVVALIIGIGGESTRTVAAMQETKEVVLPDGSKVFLNKGSELTYSQDNWEEQRTIYLKGEGYFEVEKGSEFKVQNSLGEVKVLGTAFNVFSRGEFFEVSCFHGKVSVESHGENVILTQGLEIQLSNNELSDAKNFKGARPDWQEKMFSFDHAELERVFLEIENEFGVEIEYNNDEELFFTGSFNISTLQMSLEAVCLSMNLSYEINGNQILVFEE